MRSASTAHTPGYKIEQHQLGVDAFDFSLNLSDSSETCATWLRLAPKAVITVLSISRLSLIGCVTGMERAATAFLTDSATSVAGIRWARGAHLRRPDRLRPSIGWRRRRPGRVSGVSARETFSPSLTGHRPTNSNRHCPNQHDGSVAVYYPVPWLGIALDRVAPRVFFSNSVRLDRIIPNQPSFFISFLFSLSLGISPSPWRSDGRRWTELLAGCVDRWSNCSAAAKPRTCRLTFTRRPNRRTGPCCRRAATSRSSSPAAALPARRITSATRCTTSASPPDAPTKSLRVKHPSGSSFLANRYS